MKKLRVVVPLALLAAAPFVVMRSGDAAAPMRENVTLARAGDPELAAAKARARSTIGEFLRVAAAPPGDARGFAFKYAVKDGPLVEHFWLSYRGREGDRLIGAIDARPEMVSGVVKGQVLRVALADVEDWTYLQGGKVRGNASACVLLARSKPDQFPAIKAKLGLDCP